MDPKKFAMYGGLLMLLMGAVSLVPNLVGTMDGLPLLKLNTSYGEFLGIFPMNVVNKMALILFGIAGIAAANLKFTALPRSILFSRVVFVVMGLAAIAGIIPQTQTGFGYWPLFGYEALAHAAFAVVGGYFGFALTQKVSSEIRRDPKLKATFQGGH